MITGQMIHEAFNSVTSNNRVWSELTVIARSTYTQMATHLNTIAGLPQPCPFCAFYERPTRPIALDATIGDVPACTDCAEANLLADITEMLLEWLEEVQG